MTYVARIKPYDPRKGQVGRSFAHMGLNRRFVEGVLYTGISAQEAEVLRAISQPPAGRGLLFDVGTPEEMSEVLANETAAKLGVSRAAAPLVVPPPAIMPPRPPAPVPEKMAPLPPEPDLAPPPPPIVGVPIEQLDHTDAGGVRVRHTQDAPAPAAVQEAPAARPTAGPKRRGGSGK